MLINTSTLSIISEQLFRSKHKNVSFPSTFTDGVLAPFGYANLNPTTPPTYDSWTHRLTEGTPEQREGKWYQAWVLEPMTHTPEEEAERLADAKSTKLSEINTVTDATIAVLTETYPDREIATFDKQESEARAYAADATASTPLLSALAEARGISLPDLVERVLAKADAFAVASGSIIGQRQALEDRLDACTTVEEVQGITVNISMPGGGEA